MKLYNIYFNSKQVNKKPEILITKARQLLRTARKNSGRKFNKNTDYISIYCEKR